LVRVVLVVLAGLVVRVRVVMVMLGVIQDLEHCILLGQGLLLGINLLLDFLWFWLKLLVVEAY
jgi:hypothetical protein